jgi:hypothetical protein
VAVGGPLLSSRFSRLEFVDTGSCYFFVSSRPFACLERWRRTTLCYGALKAPEDDLFTIHEDESTKCSVKAGEGVLGGAPSGTPRVAVLEALDVELCKLCVEVPKVGKSAYCKKCRRKVEATSRTIKDPEGLKMFKELEKSSDATRLRIVVADAEAVFNPEGEATRGKPRTGTFDILGYKDCRGTQRLPWTYDGGNMQNLL